MALNGTGRRARGTGWLAGVMLAAGAASWAVGTQPEDSVGNGEGAGTMPRRVVRLFTFEEEKNPDPVPPQWMRTTLSADGHERDGFPKFNRGALDTGTARSGSRSVKLPTSGGSTALRLRPGEVPIFSEADYAVAAQVRTDGLTHARAFITARLLDQQLRPIAGTEVRSEPAITGGLWRTVQVHVPGRRRGGGATGAGGVMAHEAAWLQIDLELLQPRQFEPSLGDDPAAKALSQHRVWREDVRGAAWFDDVSVMQIPRAALATTSPRNIVRGTESPTLMLTVRDLGGDALRAKVEVRDLAGRVVAEHETPIDPGGRPVSWTPNLPGYGWFSARMDVFITEGEERKAERSGEAVSKADAWFVRIPPGIVADRSGESEGAGSVAAAARARVAELTLSDRARFGLIAEATPEDRWSDLPEITSRLGTGFIHLPAWQVESTIAGAGKSLSARRSTIESLLRTGQTVTLTLTGLPSELVRSTRVPADNALALSAVDGKEWLPYLAPTLDIFGQRIVRYQIGATGGDHAFWKDSIEESIEAMRGRLGTMVPGPEIAIPWMADRDWSGRADVRAGRVRVDGVTLVVPPGLRPDAVHEWVAQFDRAATKAGAHGTTPELTVVFDLPQEERYEGWSRVSDLARRTIEFWRACADPPAHPAAPDEPLRPARLALDQPWVWSGESMADDGRAPLWPKPELAAMATLMDRLSGRRIVGELRSTPGVKCYILAARNAALGTLDHGALVAWNESADPARASVDAAALGAAVTVVDLFGNRTNLAAGSAAGGGSAGGDSGGASPLISVNVGEAPVFIEGIDPYLALFAASFRLEPGFMPAVVREHEHRIILTNPWPLRITGKLQLKEDTDRAIRPGRVVTDEWRVSPSGIIDFDMAPGQTLSVPVSLSFGPGQIAGIKDFVIVARAMADRAYPPVRLKATIEVGLADIELNPELQVVGTGAGSDLVVVAAVTNKGTRPRTLRLETAAKSMPSQQLQISDLPPGQTVLRRFVFRDAAKALSGRRIVISLSDLEEAQRLNKAVLVP